jgi:hypothetical protein
VRREYRPTPSLREHLTQREMERKAVRKKEKERKRNTVRKKEKAR